VRSRDPHWKRTKKLGTLGKFAATWDWAAWGRLPSGGQNYGPAPDKEIPKKAIGGGFVQAHGKKGGGVPFVFRYKAGNFYGVPNTVTEAACRRGAPPPNRFRGEQESAIRKNKKTVDSGGGETTSQKGRVLLLNTKADRARPTNHGKGGLRDALKAAAGQQPQGTHRLHYVLYQPQGRFRSWPKIGRDGSRCRFERVDRRGEKVLQP